MAVLCDSYSESNQNTQYILNSDGTQNQYAGQTFTGNGGVLASAKFYSRLAGILTGLAYAEVYAHTGTFGDDGKPTGAVLATSDAFDPSGLTTSYELTTYNFSGVNKITLTNATNYCAVVHYANDTGTNFLFIGSDNSSPSHGGNAVFNTGSTWFSQNTNDVCFYIYTDDPATSVKDIIGPGIIAFPRA